MDFIKACIPYHNEMILFFLAQDGLTNGAIYALLGLALVLVFAVTRIIFVPQGEFVAFGALTYALLETGKMPDTLNLLLIFGLVAGIFEFYSRRHDLNLKRFVQIIGYYIAIPVCIYFISHFFLSNAPQKIINIFITLLIVAPMGIYLYRIVYEPIAEASVLTLFIVSIGTHLALTGLALLAFGPEGLRAGALVEGTVSLGKFAIKGQTLAIYALTLGFMLFLWLFFGKTIFGKALRATAVNRLGARLQGIKTSQSGRIAFLLASLMGALSGILIIPATTIYYDSGFLIGLKGFVAAIIGGLVSYPLTFAAALFVGLIEAFSSFCASNYKEIIVFTLLMPVLVYRSLTSHHIEEDEE